MSKIIVTSIPLDKLWGRDDEQLDILRKRNLNTPEIISILKDHPIEFVVASSGSPLDWIPIEKCFEFWKSEVKALLADKEEFILDSFPDEYAYVASEWSGQVENPIILLEKYH